MYDLIIGNGTVIDGTGAERIRADVAVKNGKIAAIGKFSRSDADEFIDADGLIVSPGFIDIHTHYDAQLLWDPTASPSPYHGVTTIIGGLCGFTLAPITSDATDYLIRMLARVEDIPLAALHAGVHCDWTTTAQYRARLAGRVAVNAGFLAGHSTIRRVVMGERGLSERARPEDIHAMKKLLRQSISQGALGFSTSHSTSHSDHNGNPVPSRAASFEEFIALSEVCREFEGTHVEIQPGLTFDDEAAELVTAMSLASERTVSWNPMIVQDCNPETRAHVERQLRLSDHARERGGDAIALAVPTSAGFHMDLIRGTIFDCITGWDALFRMSVEDRLREFSNPERRRVLFEQARDPASPGVFMHDPDMLVVEQGFTDATRAFNGKSVGEVARMTGKSYEDAMSDIVVADELKTLFTMAEAGEDYDSYAYRVELCRDNRTVLAGSDAGAHVESIDTFAFYTHFLAQAVRKYGLLPLEEAIEMITRSPARLMGLKNRGELRPGYWADIAIFDEASIARGPVHMRNDFPTGANRLYADAIGMERVIVNGETIINKGVYTGAVPGRIFAPDTDTRTVGIPGNRQTAAAE